MCVYLKFSYNYLLQVCVRKRINFQTIFSFLSEIYSYRKQQMYHCFLCLAGLILWFYIKTILPFYGWVFYINYNLDFCWVISVYFYNLITNFSHKTMIWDQIQIVSLWLFSLTYTKCLSSNKKYKLIVWYYHCFTSFLQP